jgi:hypothetical protein
MKRNLRNRGIFSLHRSTGATIAPTSACFRVLHHQTEHPDGAKYLFWPARSLPESSRQFLPRSGSKPTTRAPQVGAVPQPAPAFFDGRFCLPIARGRRACLMSGGQDPVASAAGDFTTAMASATSTWPTSIFNGGDWPSGQPPSGPSARHPVTSKQLPGPPPLAIDTSDSSLQSVGPPTRISRNSAKARSARCLRTQWLCETGPSSWRAGSIYVEYSEYSASNTRKSASSNCLRPNEVPVRTAAGAVGKVL